MVSAVLVSIGALSTLVGVAAVAGVVGGGVVVECVKHMSGITAMQPVDQEEQ